MTNGSSMFQGDVHPAHVLRGVVIAVDPVRYTVSLRPLTPQYNQLWHDIQYLNPYLSDKGAGITFVPEVGALAYVMHRGDDPYRWFVFGWGSLSDEQEKDRVGEHSYRQGRPIMSPGDIRMSTRRGNEVRLLAGGVVQIRSSGLAMRQYIPVDNIIRDFCERYHLRSLAGDLKFEVDSTDQPQPSGEYNSRLRVNVYEVTNDAKPIGELIIGEQGGAVSLNLQLRDGGESNSSVVVQITADKNGNLTLEADSTLLLQGQTADLYGTTQATVRSDTRVSVTAPTVVVTAANITFAPSAGGLPEFKIQNPRVRVQSPSVHLGVGVMAGVVRGTEFKIWAGQVSAVLAASAVGTPPVLSPTIVSTTVKVGT